MPSPRTRRWWAVLTTALLAWTAEACTPLDQNCDCSEFQCVCRDGYERVALDVFAEDGGLPNTCRPVGGGRTWIVEPFCQRDAYCRTSIPFVGGYCERGFDVAMHYSYLIRGYSCERLASPPPSLPDLFDPPSPPPSPSPPSPSPVERCTLRARACAGRCPLASSLRARTCARSTACPIASSLRTRTCAVR